MRASVLKSPYFGGSLRALQGTIRLSGKWQLAAFGPVTAASRGVTLASSSIAGTCQEIVRALFEGGPRRTNPAWMLGPGAWSRIDRRALQ